MDGWMVNEWMDGQSMDGWMVSQWMKISTIMLCCAQSSVRAHDLHMHSVTMQRRERRACEAEAYLRRQLPCWKRACDKNPSLVGPFLAWADQGLGWVSRLQKKEQEEETHRMEKEDAKSMMVEMQTSMNSAWADQGWECMPTLSHLSCVKGFHDA